ncbi:MAG: acyl-CoA dehydrogenase family protein [Desulfobacterales bacterium]|jgi:alkylation response protein AidB-like acyl-CoA dehydrogenase
MDFDFSAQDQKRFDAIRSIARAAPAEDQLAGGTPEETSKALRKVLKDLAAAGYLGLGLEGHREADAVTLMGAMETLAVQTRSLFLAVEMSTRVVGRALARWAAEPRQKQWLADLRRGEWLGALALSETTMNVENDPLATLATRKGDRICLNGQKQYVINAPLADRIGIVGMLEERPALFFVDRSADGLIISERRRTMGYDGLHLSDLVCRECDLPKEDVLFPPQGTPVLERLRRWENEILLAAALGLMQAAYTEARDFAQSHRSGGKPIIAYQEVGFKLAEMLTLCQTAQLLAYRAVWTMACEPKEGISLIWCAKVFATEAAERVAGDALRILAGQGFCSGSAAASAYRAVKWTQIGGLSTEIARVKIGDHALGYR